MRQRWLGGRTRQRRLASALFLPCLVALTTRQFLWGVVIVYPPRAPPQPSTSDAEPFGRPRSSEKAPEKAPDVEAGRADEGQTTPPPTAVAERPNATAAGGPTKRPAASASSAKNIKNATGTFPRLPWSLPAPPREIVSSEEFMSRIGRLKRDRGVALPWESWNHSNITARLPRPIVQLSLPKSATLTLSQFFACGGVPSRHTQYRAGNYRIGDCMLDNLLADDDRPPFAGCDVINSTTVKHGRAVRTSKWADGTPIEFYSDIGMQAPRCFYSTVHDGGLEHIARHHPDSTMVLIHRGFDSWYDSVKRWGDGRLLSGWRKRCGFRGSGGRECANGDGACWRSFYDGHMEKIRRFALDHLGITYIEVGLGGDTAGTLERYTGRRSGCLEHCLPGKPKDPTVDLRTYRRCLPNRTATQAGEVTGKTDEGSEKRQNSSAQD